MTLNKYLSIHCDKIGNSCLGQTTQLLVSFCHWVSLDAEVGITVYSGWTLPELSGMTKGIAL